jgi:muconolactone delta-isomerase
MEFLVEFEINIPEGTPSAEVKEREDQEVAAAAKLAAEGHLLRAWKRTSATGEATVLGLYRGNSKLELDGLLSALPLYDWMNIAVTLLGFHPNDPGIARSATAQEKDRPGIHLPPPQLTRVYRLEAALGQPLELGETAFGRRRIVPRTGGTFTGPDLSGTLLAGASADWQIVTTDGTAAADLRYTLQTDQGAVLYVQSQGVRHGSAEVLARLGRGEEVDASEYTFRMSTRIETAVAELDWLNKGVFVTVGGRRPAGVIYETYLVR